MRVSQDAGAGAEPEPRSGNGGWFQVVETMRRVRVEDGTMIGMDREIRRDGGAMLAQTLDFSDVRLEKVAELRAAIAAGRYRVPASKLAERMMGRLAGGLERRRS